MAAAEIKTVSYLSSQGSHCLYAPVPESGNRGFLFINLSLEALNKFSRTFCLLVAGRIFGKAK